MSDIISKITLGMNNHTILSEINAILSSGNIIGTNCEVGATAVQIKTVHERHTPI